MIETGRRRNQSHGFRQHLKSTLQQLRDERDAAVALLQEVRVAVLAFPNRAGILLVNSASSFKASGVSPLLPPAVGNTHGRVVAKSCAPGPGARERTVARRGGAGVAAHDLRGAGAAEVVRGDAGAASSRDGAFAGAGAGCAAFRDDASMGVAHCWRQ